MRVSVLASARVSERYVLDGSSALLVQCDIVKIRHRHESA